MLKVNTINSKSPVIWNISKDRMKLFSQPVVYCDCKMFADKSILYETKKNEGVFSAQTQQLQ